MTHYTITITTYHLEDLNRKTWASSKKEYFSDGDTIGAGYRGLYSAMDDESWEDFKQFMVDHGESSMYGYWNNGDYRIAWDTKVKLESTPCSGSWCEGMEDR